MLRVGVDGSFRLLLLSDVQWGEFAGDKGENDRHKSLINALIEEVHGEDHLDLCVFGADSIHIPPSDVRDGTMVGLRLKHGWKELSRLLDTRGVYWCGLCGKVAGVDPSYQVLCQRASPLCLTGAMRRFEQRNRLSSERRRRLNIGLNYVHVVESVEGSPAFAFIFLTSSTRISMQTIVDILEYVDDLPSVIFSHEIPVELIGDTSTLDPRRESLLPTGFMDLISDARYNVCAIFTTRGHPSPTNSGPPVCGYEQTDGLPDSGTWWKGVFCCMSVKSSIRCDRCNSQQRGGRIITLDSSVIDGECVYRLSTRCLLFHEGKDGDYLLYSSQITSIPLHRKEKRPPSSHLPLNIPIFSMEV